MAAAALDVMLVLALIPWLKELGAALALLITEMSVTAALFVILGRMRLNPFQKIAIETSVAPQSGTLP